MFNTQHSSLSNCNFNFIRTLADPGLQAEQGDPMTSARLQRRGLCPQRGPDAGFRVRAPGQGTLKLLFACGVKNICLCVIYNRERSERKIVLPIDISRFPMPPQGSSLEEGHGRIRTSLADRQIQEAIFLKLQNDTDLQTEVRTHLSDYVHTPAIY